MQIELIEAQPADKSVLRNLMELYWHDFSEIDGADVNEHGLYEYNRLDSYWTEADRAGVRVTLMPGLLPQARDRIEPWMSLSLVWGLQVKRRY